MTDDKTADLFSKNINIQSQNEWKIYEQSLSFLLNHPEGKKYLILFEMVGRVCIQTILQKHIVAEDDKTIAYIGARVFNSGMVCFRSCMNGYYQIAVSLIRDLIEIQFLLDYFKYKPEKIAEWRKANNKERYKNFGPQKLYTELDKRDGFKDENRKKTYQMFCEYAAHVSFPGIKLTTNDKGVVLVGPFYDEKKLLNTLVEIVRRFAHTVMSLVVLLPKRDISAIQSQLELMKYFSDVFNLSIKDDTKYKESLAFIESELKKHLRSK